MDALKKREDQAMYALDFRDPTFMSPFAFAGDWHGDAHWVIAKIQSLASKGIKRVYQLGDFGLWPGAEGKKYLDMVASVLEKTGIELYVILGNHEDYNRVKTMRFDKDGWRKLANPDYAKIHFAPRGHTWMDSGLRFAALGGAGSVDRLIRVEGKSWWPGEEITDEDVETTKKNFAKTGWDRVDFFLTHDAPSGVPLKSGFAGHRPWWFTEEVQYSCNTQRNRLRNATDEVRPHVLVHGHWHDLSQHSLSGISIDQTEYEATVIGLPNEGFVANIWIPTYDEIQTFLGYPVV